MIVPLIIFFVVFCLGFESAISIPNNAEEFEKSLIQLNCSYNKNSTFYDFILSKKLSLKDYIHKTDDYCIIIIFISNNCKFCEDYLIFNNDYMVPINFNISQVIRSTLLALTSLHINKIIPIVLYEISYMSSASFAIQNGIIAVPTILIIKNVNCSIKINPNNKSFNQMVAILSRLCIKQNSFATLEKLSISSLKSSNLPLKFNKAAISEKNNLKWSLIINGFLSIISIVYIFKLSEYFHIICNFLYIKISWFMLKLSVIRKRLIYRMSSTFNIPLSMKIHVTNSLMSNSLNNNS